MCSKFHTLLERGYSSRHYGYVIRYRRLIRLRVAAIVSFGISQTCGRNHIWNIAIHLSSLYANVLHSSPYPRAFEQVSDNNTRLSKGTGHAIVRHNREWKWFYRKHERLSANLYRRLSINSKPRCAIFSPRARVLFRSSFGLIAIFSQRHKALDKSAIIRRTFYMLSSRARVSKWKVCGDINI